MSPRCLRADILAGRRRLRYGKTPSRRRGTALYGVVFLLAVAAAPHRHLNSFEDLVSDGPSDSGILIQASAADPAAEIRIQAACLVDDDPCPACFHNDFAAQAATAFLPKTTLARLALTVVSFPPAEIAARTSLDRSRAPPAA